MSLKARDVMLWVATLPYYWTFRNYTLLPLESIASSTPNRIQVVSYLQKFIAGKRHELYFINVASTLSAAATVGVFSWPSIENTIWLAQALWNCTLCLAICALLLSAQHTALIDSLPSSEDDWSDETLKRLLRKIVDHVPSKKHAVGTEQQSQDVEHVENQNACYPIVIPLSRNMVYVWQCPLMLMGWSWISFLVAETLHVARPLLPYSHENNDKKIAIFYLSFSTLLVLNFAWCSFWIYRDRNTYGLESHDQIWDTYLPPGMDCEKPGPPSNGKLGVVNPSRQDSHSTASTVTLTNE